MVKLHSRKQHLYIPWREAFLYIIIHQTITIHAQLSVKAGHKVMFSQTQKCKDQELEKEVVSADSGNRGLKKKRSPRSVLMTDDL